MKDHLSRDTVKKRITMQAQKIAADLAAEAAAVQAAIDATAAAALAAENGSLDGSAASAASAESAAPVKPPVEMDLEVNSFSGVNKWGAYLGLTTETMSQEATRALHAPPSLVPTDELELNWVYGCSARQARGSVQYTKEGNIAYPAGCIGVIFDKVAGTQKYSMPHCDEITCLDVSVSAGLAVSAHKGNGTITACMWRTSDGSIQRYFDCGLVNGVSAIQFSPDAKHVALACQDKDHTVKVFSTVDGRMRASFINGAKKPLCLSFSLAEANPANWTAPIRILQGGVNHFKFLSFYPSRSALFGKTGAYGADVRKSNVNCIGALPLQPGADGGESTGNEFILGMADGSIGVVGKGENKVSAFTPIMKGAITAICVVKVKEGTAEEAPVYRIVVGGINGAMKVLDQELQPIAQWNLYLSEFGLLPMGRVRGYKSLCVDKLNRKILYATAGGEIGELELNTGADVNAGPLVYSHYRDQLHALCAHPLRQECITAGEQRRFFEFNVLMHLFYYLRAKLPSLFIVPPAFNIIVHIFTYYIGDDKTLRVWHLDKKKMATSIDLPDIARTATYSPNGHLIVAGLGGEVQGKGRSPRPLRGKVVVISYLQGVLRIVHTTGDALDTITAVMFTPDGSKMLASSLDGSVYIYDALNNFALVMTLSGQHKEGVRSMDISNSGQYVATTGEFSEYFVWDMSTGAVIGKDSDRFEALAATGLEWNVRQAPFGLNSVGIFPSFSDPADTLTLNQSKDHKLLAVGDSYGALKLFRNPATEYFAPYKKYTAHSPGGISKVAFTVKDQFLMSVGRFDKVLVQWKVVKSADLPDNKPEVDSVAAEPVVHEEDFNATYTMKGVSFIQTAKAVNFDGKAEIKAQLNTIVGTGTSKATLPRAAFFGQGDIITAYGKLPVLLDGNGSGAQKVLYAPGSGNPYSNPAQQVVSSIAVSPTGQYALIGHSSGAADSRLIMVGAPSGQLVSELSANIPGGVTATCFSEDGKSCACLGGDAQHTLYVYRTYSGFWDDATLLSSMQVSAGNISLVSFIPTAADATADGASAGFDLVTAGAGHTKFWRIQGQNLNSTCGEYGDSVMNKPTFTALCALTGADTFRSQVVTGDSEGSIYFWRNGVQVSTQPAHSSAVTALKSFGGASSASNGFISGSNDKLFIWGSFANEASARITHTFSVPSLLSSMGWSSAIYLSDKFSALNYITSIDTDPMCDRLVVSFASSPIITLTKDSGTVQKISEGHDRSSKVNGIVAHPTDANAVLTIAEDGMLRMWNVGDNTVVGAGGEAYSNAMTLTGSLQMKHVPTAACFLNANVLLVAVRGADTNGNSGAVFMVSVNATKSHSVTDCKYRMVVMSRLHNIGTGSLLHLRISSMFKYLAACSEDGCAYVYRIDGVDASGNLKGQWANAASGESKSAVDDLADNLFTAMGFLLAHPTGARVVGIDFTADDRFARTFGENFAKANGKVEVSFFDFGKSEQSGDEVSRVHAGVKIQDAATLETVKNAKWTTMSSPAAAELRGVNYASTGADLTLFPVQANAVSANTSKDSPLVCASYEDGSTKVYR